MRRQALADVGKQPLVGNFEEAVIGPSFWFASPNSPPGPLGSGLENIAFGRDGDTGSSPAIAIGRDVFDQVDVLLVALEIGNMVTLPCLLLIRSDAILHVKGDVGRCHGDN